MRRSALLTLAIIGTIPLSLAFDALVPGHENASFVGQALVCTVLGVLLFRARMKED